MVSFIILFVIGLLDFITGYEFGFFIFYFIPVSLSAWSTGRKAGLFMACMSAAAGTCLIFIRRGSFMVAGEKINFKSKMK